MPLLKTRRTVALLAAAALLAASGLAAFLWACFFKGSGGNASSWPGAQQPPLVRQAYPNTGDAFNLLVVLLGSEGSGRSVRTVADTTILVRLDLRIRRAACLFMPRTTYLEIRDLGKRTLDELWVLGGLSLLKDALQDITGMIIEHYMVIDKERLARLIDLYGEVGFTLPEAVPLPNGGSLEAGAAQLDGREVVEVVTYDGYRGGELARIAVQQSLLLSAAAQLHRAASLPAFCWTVNLSVEELDTDLPADSLLRLAREFSSWPVADLSVGTAPGSSGTLGGRKKVYLLDDWGMRNAISSILATATVPAP